MRSLRHLAITTIALASLVAAHAACTSDTDTDTNAPATGGDADGGSKRPDGARPDDPIEDASVGDAAEEAPLPTAQEQEPNNGAAETEVNAMTIPGAMTGAINPANDIDIFSVALSPGDLWEWTLAPKSAELAPHLVLFDTTKDSLNPTVLATGGAGDAVSLQHFVLRPGAFVAAVRDARNVPTAAGKGGPAFGYTLTAKKKTPQPTAIAVSQTKTGALASLSSVDLYTFTLAKQTGVDLIVRAARKAAPSTLDSRVSLFDATNKEAVGTNDDATGATTDSEIGGTLPAGTYLVVLESEGTNGADLSYELELKPR